MLFPANNNLRRDQKWLSAGALVLAPHLLPVQAVRVVIFLSPQPLHPNPDVISPLHEAVMMCQGEMQGSTLSVLKCYTCAIFNVIIYQGIFKLYPRA